jgi:hypothetical protein
MALKILFTERERERERDREKFPFFEAQVPLRESPGPRHLVTVPP